MLQLDVGSLRKLKPLARYLLPISEEIEFENFIIELPALGDDVRKFKNTQLLFYAKGHLVQNLKIQLRGNPVGHVKQTAHSWMYQQLCEIRQLPRKERKLRSLK